MKYFPTMHLFDDALRPFRCGVGALTLSVLGASGTLAVTVQAPAARTPIQHVIVLIGENRTFDHLFATYVPASGDSVENLLSEGIINADGTPGPHYARAAQFQAVAPFQTQYFISLDQSQKALYQTLPAPTLNHSPSPAIGEPPPFPAPTKIPVLGDIERALELVLLASVEPSLETSDLPLLWTGASGAAQTAELPDFDWRISNYDHLSNGPFPLRGTSLPYDSYHGDTTHRLFEMWQQSDCSVTNATPQNPSGCLNDLYPFVVTHYASEPDPSSIPTPNQVVDTGGGNSMAFYNMQKGDAPILKALADQYSMSDNYHQGVMGGSGPNHVMLGTGDMIFWSDGNGNATTPPSHFANPNPRSGSDDQYAADINSGGNFTNCADPTQPGIAPIQQYLQSLPYHPGPNCEIGHYYMVNDENPGFLPDGTLDAGGIAGGTSVPPSQVRTIGEALDDNHISWAYYGGAYNAAVKLTQLQEQGRTTSDPTIEIGKAYCNDCNFESYSSVIMGNPAERAAHIKDATDFFAMVDNSTLPAVSFVKPDELLDGHPGSSKVDLFEGMVKKIIDHLAANPGLFASTVLFITMDEGGGYYDSGYIQPLDFFGDGPRIPLIAVSPFSAGGHISHAYADHVSILKFIERNWGLSPLTPRSRDNLPNPQSLSSNPYVPVNSPAISDLFDLFNFGN